MDQNKTQDQGSEDQTKQEEQDDNPVFHDIGQDKDQGKEEQEESDKGS